MRQYFPEFRIYRPNKSGNGAATKFQFSIEDGEKPRILLFVESAKQTGTDANGNASFDWKGEKGEKVSMKLEELDIGELLAVLTRKKKAVGTGKGLYHQSGQGKNSVLNFTYEADKDVYYFGLSNKNGDKLTQVKHVISVADGEVLRVLLECVLRRMYNW